MTSTEFRAVDTRRRAPSLRWRVVDIVVAAVLAVACGAIFLAWSATGGGAGWAALDAATPGLGGLMLGAWLLGGLLGGLIIRKPGAAIFVEVLAAVVEMAFGAQWGIQGVVSGLVQGFGCELILLAVVYRRSGPVVAVLMGGVAAALEWVLELFMIPNIAKGALFNSIYLGTMIVSGLVFGVVAWLLVKALAATGVLDRFPAGRKAASAA